MRNAFLEDMSVGQRFGSGTVLVSAEEIMQSTTSPSIIARRISPSPDWVEDIEPLASTTPAVPEGARWYRMCCSHA